MTSFFQFYRFVLPNVMRIKRGKVLYRQQPIANQKILITGLGDVSFGNNNTFGFKLGGNYYGGLIEIQPRLPKSRIVFGNNISTNNNLIICAANYVEIGDNALIGEGVSIMDHEGHGIRPDERQKLGIIGKVIIGKNVWIGNRVMILKNSVIGDNTVVAAGAVVAGEFPANVIIGGVPAKIIKTL